MAKPSIVSILQLHLVGIGACRSSPLRVDEGIDENVGTRR